MNRYLFTVALIFASHLSFSEDMGRADTSGFCTQSVSLSGNHWRIATDSANEGIRKGWFRTPPVAASRATAVPWIIQDVFHDYHGVAWYWREFIAPVKKSGEKRYALKFHSVDYRAEVWLNGKKIGIHENSEFAFELDATDALAYGGKNLLVVRVLNPTYEAIDDISLKETASSAKHYPYTSNAFYNSGGITGQVELLTIPLVRINDLFITPDWKTGKVRILTTIVNRQSKAVAAAALQFNICEARSGKALTLKIVSQRLEPGTNMIETEIQLSDFMLWSPDEPFLYRLTASTAGARCTEEQSARFGFRDFRFENGYYRLNGKRIFLIGGNSSTHYPVGYTIPLYEDMLRRDVLNMKALGQNFVRIPFGCPNPRIFDIYDELGILVHQEHYGSWQMAEFGGFDYKRPDYIKDSITQRFEASLSGVIKRDRNHPSIVMWGALNETHDGYVFRKAVDMLPQLRALDPGRLMVLNSGRFDLIKEIGSMSSPGSDTWDVAETQLKDWHPYVWIPYSASSLDQLSGRSPQLKDQKIYISESGLCFPLDLPAELGDYQRWGKAESDDARYFKRQYDKFMADWKKFGLGDCWVRPEDYIRDAYITANSLRETGESAIRANPSVVAYTPTNGVADYAMGESVATNFRRLKPELIPSALLANSPVRWCLETEPHSLYSGGSVRLNASFSNLDVLPPGRYPATFKLVSPDLKTIFEKKASVVIRQNQKGDEAPYAQEILMENVPVAGKAGRYQFLATLDSGGTALGGKTDFYVTERSGLSGLPAEIVLCGEDPAVNEWLKQRQVKIVSLDRTTLKKRNIIVIAGKKSQDSVIMISIAKNMAQGSVVIFLTPETLKKGDNSSGWLPAVDKGRIEPVDHVAGYYRADRWAKNHPFFEGMPAGGMMDYKYFRNVISLQALCQEYNIRAKPTHTFAEVSAPLTYPDETICGATRISHNYCSGVHLGIWNFGQGQFIVNTLHISDNLGSDPAADRLFSNMLRFVSKDLEKPLAALPEKFNDTISQIGYQR
jgi:hypothetical protein